MCAPLSLALFKAIAIACLCPNLPVCSNSEIFELITFWLLPEVRGMSVSLICKHCKNYYIVPYNQSKRSKYCSRSCLWHNQLSVREPKRLAAITGKTAANNAGYKFKCLNCGTIKPIAPSRIGKSKFCTTGCYFAAVKKINPIKKNNTYKKITINGKRYLEHRYIMEKYINKKLKRTQHVHHINGNKRDNRIENLEIINIRAHARMHKINPFNNPKIFK